MAHRYSVSMLGAIDDYFDPNGYGCAEHPNALTCAGALVARYVHSFTGALFDPRQDEPWWDPNYIAPSDLVSVATLSMPAFAQQWFLQR